MLQQTQVSAVRKAFENWMRDFPTVQVLAKASEDSVLFHWQGLGYYSRAKNIYRAARRIVELGGEFPSTRKELESLPGIGAYTAGAILSLAFHRNEAILDGNLIRIFSRLEMWNFLPTDGKSEKERYWDAARNWANIGKAFLTNEALMELGRTVCKKARPECSKCPLRKICKAFREKRQTEFPPTKKVRYTTWTGYALAVFDSCGNILLNSSPDSPFLKNHLSFPLFESADTSKKTFPAAAETVIPFENVERFRFTGTFEHSITRYKIACRVLCIQVKSQKGIRGEWIPERELSRRLVSSLARKILVLTHDFRTCK